MCKEIPLPVPYTGKALKSGDIKFAFTHQMFDNVTTAGYRAACPQIADRIMTADFRSITDAYKTKHTAWMKAAWEADTPPGWAKMKTKGLGAINPDFELALKGTKTINKYIKVEKTYICMDSIVVVCSMRGVHVNKVSEMLLGWVNVLALAFQQRNEYEARLIEHTNPRRMGLLSIFGGSLQ